MNPSFVYVIAFDDSGRFLMVRHTRRAWEMPGGAIEEGEAPGEAAIREFLEETGMELLLSELTIEEGGGLVFTGRVGSKLGKPKEGEIAEVGFFHSLPDELSFPRVEYEKMIKELSVLLDQE